MSWYPDIANTGFCETLRLRKIILERQRLPRSTRPPVLEPASAEFLSALAAGSNSRHILQIGCGLSTIALAAAAKATGTCLISVNSDQSQQDIVQRHIKELGLDDYVEFFCEEPLDFVPSRENVDFVFITGDATVYIQIFDLLHLKSGAIVVADFALSDSTNEYIKHVRKQPGVDSSTLFVGRGIEITKITSWEQFKAGRKRYTGPSDDSDGLDSFTKARKSVQTTISNASSSTALYSSKGSSSIGLSRTSSEAVLPTKAKNTKEVEKTSSIATQTMLSSLADLQGSNLADLVIQATSNISPEAIAGLELNETPDTTAAPTTSMETSTAHVITVLTTSNLLSLKSLSAVESKPSVRVHFKNDNFQTEITIEGEDQDMLLTDITLAFSEAAVSVRRAKIATQDKYIEDVFYVVDTESQKPLQASQFDTFKEKLFKRIADRKQTRRREGGDLWLKLPEVY
ncbi:hypothetical protein MPTK1_1g22520 [Marchantia polymorpha subsp. ruderalis]|uniref:ACT domain-containing protein n=2 Tax=Marchantia polymorpha TaxID=3197 RepID=A0AAF6AT53_MARPO|nr:hypothetical protein MARPO_0118s0035 [Marchantia polymorpha]BBM99623.1 hypothetical protein Mp_1g22520 [Marchantia polymorpha subsp. ruderalis]|eukprot:PTQ30901.1 hypothetical protein MARPO_0118s0035 [Marchantia polymorpha]